MRAWQLLSNARSGVEEWEPSAPWARRLLLSSGRGFDQDQVELVRGCHEELALSSRRAAAHVVLAARLQEIGTGTQFRLNAAIGVVNESSRKDNDLQGLGVLVERIHQPR